jgi:hypothetical protein
LTLALSIAVPRAQQTPAGAGAPPSGQPERKVVVVGENPAVRKLDKEGGTAVASGDFFRVTWSPAGAGSICAIRVTDATDSAGNLMIAIYDSKAVYDYMVKEIRPDYGKYTPVQGTITQKDTPVASGTFTRTETCRSDKYTVDLIWKDLGQARFTDAPMFNNTVQMAMTMVPAASGDIVINGKSAPGTWYARGGGIGTGAYLMLAEVWRR